MFIPLATNPHSHALSVCDPFEKIEFYQFLHYLLELSWMLYASKRVGYEGTPGILASAFVKLLADDIFPNAGIHKGRILAIIFLVSTFYFIIVAERNCEAWSLTLREECRLSVF